MLSELQSSTLTYTTSDDLASILEPFITEKTKLRAIKKKAIANSGHFSLEEMQHYFINTLLKHFP
jgi:hypothetical protein